MWLDKRQEAKGDKEEHLCEKVDDPEPVLEAHVEDKVDRDVAHNPEDADVAQGLEKVLALVRLVQGVCGCWVGEANCVQRAQYLLLVDVCRAERVRAQKHHQACREVHHPLHRLLHTQARSCFFVFWLL